MSPEVILLTLSVVAGAYMAWNIGANDCANAMASAVGAKVITIRQALVLATILTFLGATFVGSHVSQTILKGIIDQKAIGDPVRIWLGLLSALFAASLWVCLSTYKNLPVSTTHSIVGAMMGVGLVAGGPGVVHWGQLAYIFSSWILSPILSGMAGFLLFKFIDRTILSRMDTARGAVVTSPFLVAATLFIMTLALFLETPLAQKLGFRGAETLIVPGFVAIAGYFVCFGILKHKLRQGRFTIAEQIFRYLQVMTSCYVSFGTGANDVANAMGPLAGIYYIYSTGLVAEKAPVPITLLAFGGVMICVGICTWGHRVIETMGSKITELTSVRGFTVEFSAATVILIASMLGLPVSTTHAAVGAFVGVGLARGLQGLLDLGTLARIMVYWVITVPVAAVTSVIIYIALLLLFKGTL
ncbi:MAG: inorganic phosphate transporter [Desulfomonile tiedjei]|uniref:Phosphate transporter n=1 Tax=Desulfomonile tiedjei TaxID=2358 RepID=A0A9D6Z4B1_9BACT|nr:inorganic phosphate transporter [Desulfomonile tiedjei]